MINSITHKLFQRLQRPTHRQVPLAALLAVVSLSSGNANAVIKNLPAVPSIADRHQPALTAEVRLSDASSNNNNRITSVKQLSDGVYVYGQSSQPEEIGREYMVFEVRDGGVIGAFYMPHSEFNCFRGTLEAQQLKVTFANPSSDDIAEGGLNQTEQFQPLAAATPSSSNQNNFEAVSFPFAVKLQNYHQIARVSENDQRILGMCKVNQN